MSTELMSVLRLLYQYIIMHQVAQQRNGKNQKEGKMQSMPMLSV